MTFLRRGLVLLLALPQLALPGCGSLVHGWHQTVRIETEPPGATAIVLPDGLTVETPAELSLERKRVYTLRIEREGYEPVWAYVDRVTSWTAEIERYLYFPLVLPGYLLLTFDATHGAAFELTPDSISVTLTPLEDGLPGEDVDPTRPGEAGTPVDSGGLAPP